MPSAKDIHVAPISSADARELVRRIHYSGKVANNSQLHFGVFLDGRLEGAMQFGPSLDKRKIQGLVRNTGWNDFLELNRMAFSDRLPRNSESRALGVAFRLIKKHYPHIEWVISFADGTQCGDGTIYRAAGFVLTDVRKNKDVIRDNAGNVTHSIAQKTGKNKAAHYLATGGASRFIGEPLAGFQLRYIYFLNPAARERLTVPVLPFSKIAEMNAGMYRGEKVTRGKDQDAGHPPALGGETPTPTLQNEAPKVGAGDTAAAG